MDELTEEEAEEVDRAMNRHMNGHAFSNSVISWTCGDLCRKEALREAVNRVIKERSDEWEKRAIKAETALERVRLLCFGRGKVTVGRIHTALLDKEEVSDGAAERNATDSTRST